MKNIFRFNNKRALSDVVAYVLLISITIALSVLVYDWLRFYVGEDDIPVCPEGVNIIITDYTCITDDKLSVTLKNKGKFTVDGFVLRVHNRTDADFGIYTLNASGAEIVPGEEHYTVVNLSDVSIVTYLEVQPFIREGNDISCRSIATQKVSSCVT